MAAKSKERAARRAALERWINGIWYPAGGRVALTGRLLLLLLTPLEWLFAAVVRLRHAAFASGLARAGEVACPVVVVGNVSVGGTGKTPMTIHLAGMLREAGFRVGIVTRGYRGGARREVLRVDAGSDPETVGDEAVLLAARTGCDVVVGRDRLAAARLIESEVDVILADDGLQHLRLARDLEIVLVDARRCLGNGRMLPCGPLREPPSRLRSADFVVLTGSAGAQDPAGACSGRPGGLPFDVPLLRARSTPASVVSLEDGRELPLDHFAGRRVHAVAGIADPGRFFALLRAHRIEPIEHPLADHAAIAPQMLAFGDGLEVLMTEKDAVKCGVFADGRCFAVRLEMAVESSGRERLLGALRALVTAAQ